MKFTEIIKIDDNVVPMQNRLLCNREPIFIWGTGALARNVYQYCKYYGIRLNGCFVNICNLENRCFEDLPVYLISEVIEQYNSFNVIIGHSEYADGIEYLKKIENVKEVFCITNICCKVWNNISPDFIKENGSNLNECYDSLGDIWSKKCLESYFNSRINDNAEYMFPYYKKGIDYYHNDIVHLTNSETLLDIGACVGDAIWPFVKEVNNKYNAIIALEPEEENYEILKENIRSHGIENIVLKKVCAYDRDGYAKFVGDKEQGGIVLNTNSEYTLYPTVKIDSLQQDTDAAKNISIIKINFPFSVPEILKGASNLLKNRKPKIIIRIGFNENVLVQTYLTIKEINPSYKFFLRYSIGIPQGLTMFAI